MHSPRRDIVLILDFGSQYTQLIARRVRECGVYCEIHPYNLPLDRIQRLAPRALILSGGPASVFSDGAPRVSRDVLELLELVNPGTATRIAPDTLRPVWQGAIPTGVVQFDVQSGDFSSDAVVRRGDAVRLFGPLQPGGFHQLSYAYTLPASTDAIALPIDQPTVELDLLLEDTLSQATAPGLRAGGVQPIEERFFMRYRADTLPAGAPISGAIWSPTAPFRFHQVALSNAGVPQARTPSVAQVSAYSRSLS